jgi:hypothetical protein
MMMRIRQKRIASLLGAAAVAAAIGAAPVAAAEPAGAQQQPDQPHLSCQQEGASQYECESPDNVQVNDPPSADHYYSVLG